MAAITLQHTCTGCEASAGSLASAFESFHHKRTKEMKELYIRHRDDFLDPDDNVLPGKAQALRDFETTKFFGCRYLLRCVSAQNLR